MAILSGRLIYDANRRANASPTYPGIANIPIVLQNTTTGHTLVVLTDANGNYSFINVPNGNYQIVEAYGSQDAIPTPGDFNGASIKELLKGGIVPPLNFITNPPIGATNLDCVTPNTILITVTGTNVTNLNISNGPVKYTPITEIMDQNVTVLPDNLIKIADLGTFGSFTPGTPAYTFSPTQYEGIGEGFTFVQTVPRDGQYAIQNITHPQASGNTWWSFADHTTGNETGRMMVINGDYPGTLLFNETVALKQNTYYLFSAWILNMIKLIGYQPPSLGVRLIDDHGIIILDRKIGQDIPTNTNEPEWVQIGSILYSGTNTALTVQFISQGPAAIGNDYALDDVSLKEVKIPDSLPLLKEINTDKAQIGETITYTTTLKNTYDYTITDLFFKDIIPPGLSFIQGTVKVNGDTLEDADPNQGFDLPDVESDNTIIIKFSAKVDYLPTPNPTINTAELTYKYAFIHGGIPYNYEIISNEVPLLIEEEADLEIIKTAIPETVKRNEIITYLLIIINHGPATAKNVVVTDIIPNGLTDVEYSIDGGTIWRPWEGSYHLGNLENGNRFILLIKGKASTTNSTIKNTSEVKSDTTDPNLDNNTSTIETEVISTVDLSVIKTACPLSVKPCEFITYIIVVSNAGPEKAEDVILKDEISNMICNPHYSLDNGRTWHKWRTTLALGDLEANKIITILIRGIVHACAFGCIKNIAVVSSSTHDWNLHNNEYKITTIIKTFC